MGYPPHYTHPVCELYGDAFGRPTTNGISFWGTHGTSAL